MTDREILEEIKEKYQLAFQSEVIRDQFDHFMKNARHHLDIIETPEPLFDDILSGIYRNGGNHTGPYILNRIAAIKTYRSRLDKNGMKIDLLTAKNKIDEYVDIHGKEINLLLAAYNSIIQ